VVSALEVDDTGLRVRGDGDFPIDVAFDGQRIFSFWLRRDTKPDKDWLSLRWPPPLRRFLNGSVQVSLVDPVSGTTWIETSARLGDGEGAVRVEDRQGNPMGLDKSLRLTRLFGDRDAEQMEPLLDAMETVLKGLEAAGVEPFIAYGTLLGAVRDQDFIGHDSDADLGYVSGFDHPTDVVLESFRLQRRLQEMGFRIERYSGIAFKVIVREADGSPRGLDVFGGFMRAGTLYLMGEVGHPFRPEWISPRTDVVLAGRTFPAPGQPEHLLEAMYGPSWKVPDPAYKFTTPASTQRRLDGWFRGMRVGLRNRWARSRVEGPRPAGAEEPSSFAQWVAHQEPEIGTAVDIGCGRGTDALWLAGRGVPVVGLDYFPPDLRHAAGRARRLKVPAEFEWASLTEYRSTLVTGAELSRRPGPRIVLSRHVFDATNHVGRENLLRLAKMISRDSGRLYLQVQTSATPHSRKLGVRAFALDQISQLVARTGGRVEQATRIRENDDGVAGAAAADRRPTIGRMVISWSR